MQKQHVVNAMCNEADCLSILVNVHLPCLDWSHGGADHQIGFTSGFKDRYQAGMAEVSMGITIYMLAFL